MVAAHGFRPSLLERDALAEQDAALWQCDLFGVRIKRHLGIGIAAGATVGATVGGTVDMASAGHTLGLGTVLGICLGAVSRALCGGFVNRRWDRSSHTLTLRCGPGTLRALLARSLALFRALRHRGMADQRDFLVFAEQPDQDLADVKPLLKLLEEIGHRPRLCLIGTNLESFSRRARRERAEAIAQVIQAVWALARDEPER